MRTDCSALAPVFFRPISYDIIRGVEAVVAVVWCANVEKCDFPCGSRCQGGQGMRISCGCVPMLAVDGSLVFHMGKIGSLLDFWNVEKLCTHGKTFCEHVHKLWIVGYLIPNRLWMYEERVIHRVCKNVWKRTFSHHFPRDPPFCTAPCLGKDQNGRDPLSPCVFRIFSEGRRMHLGRKALSAASPCGLSTFHPQSLFFGCGKHFCSPLCAFFVTVCTSRGSCPMRCTFFVRQLCSRISLMRSSIIFSTDASSRRFCAIVS